MQLLPPQWHIRTWAISGVLVLLITLVLANVHLVYVAVSTQPDCVTHIAPGSGEAQPDKHSGALRAAKSSC